MRGISPSGTSIVLSGGYIDDEDNGTLIVYTGEGGRDPEIGRQVKDQTLTGGNAALAIFTSTLTREGEAKGSPCT